MLDKFYEKGVQVCTFFNATFVERQNMRSVKGEMLRGGEKENDVSKYERFVVHVGKV
jgi:hypothetical protein